MNLCIYVVTEPPQKPFALELTCTVSSHRRELLIVVAHVLQGF